MNDEQHERAAGLRWLIQVLTDLIDGKGVTQQHGVCTNIALRAALFSPWEGQAIYVDASAFATACIRDMADDPVPLNTSGGEYLDLAASNALWRGRQGTARRCLCSWLREIATHELKLLEGQETAARQ